MTASDVDWTWARSDTSGGPFIDLDLPEEEEGPQQYEPKDNDVGKFLRATATYIDDEDPDEDKTASKVTVNPVRSASTDDTAPVFDAPNLTRNVPENTAAGGLVGLPVAATDASPNDVLTYSLEAGQDDAATDVDSFDINPATGQIKVAEGAMLNREETGGGSYSVVVEVTDASRKMAMVDVTINLTDVDEAPTVMLPTGVEAPAFNYTENAETPLGTFTKQDPEGFTTDWELSGPDADEFEISDVGALTFKDAPNFEDPKGGPNGDSNVYQVTVGATDGVNTGMLPVSIKVMDDEDDGEVTLSPSRPEIGMPVTATLMDDDGGFTGVTWLWERGTGSGTTFTADPDPGQDGIEDAEDPMYTPERADSGKYLRVSVTYADAFGTDGSATLMEVTDNPVRVDSTNRPPMFLDMDDEVVTSYQRSVPEDVVDRSDLVNVGVVVTAENNTNGSYSLSGTDASTFRIHPGTGQITAPSETELNHETKATYTVIVTATNPAGASSRVTVTINVTDVDEMPEITGDDPEDYPEKSTVPVATFMGRDPEGSTVLWSLTETDADDDEFSITGGVLHFKNPPVFDSQDSDNNVYRVTIRASDGGIQWEDKPVMVTVTDVDEQGTIALTSRQPLAGAELMATGPNDPDGSVNADDVEWTWEKGRRNGPFVVITEGEGPMFATYSPVDVDINSYIRVTARYMDGSIETANDEAMVVSENPVRLGRANNTDPVFLTDRATRSIPENTAAGGLVGSPVAATDNDPQEVLTYSLEADQGNGATDVDSFDINPATGQIKVAEGAMLNREETDGDSYSVVVKVTDAKAATAMVNVTINLTDVNEAPTVMLPTGVEAPAFNYTENAETSLGTFTRQDPEGFTTDWELSGPDADEFEISDVGALTFKDAPNFEDPKGGPNGDSNVYQVTVGATDGVNTGMLPVSIKVMDDEDDGEVTLSPSRPEIGMPVTATLMDDDGGFTGVTWLWERGTGSGTTFTADPDPGQDGIEDAEDPMYTPERADSGKYLRVSVTYADAFGTDGSATLMEVTDNPVRVDSTNRPPMFLDMDDEVVTSYQRSVPEDVVDRSDLVNVGVVVTAEDVNDGDIPTYRLSGTDADNFDIDTNSGQITAPSGTELNHETKATYTVIVTATDPSGASSSVTVTINVTDVDEMPTLEHVTSVVAVSGTTSASYPENGTGPVETYEAMGPQAAGATWSLMGANANLFEIGRRDGVLSFRTSPDYENPMATDNVYMVTVVATSATDPMQKDMMDVMVTVTNEVELGTLTGTARFDYAENGMNAVETYTADGPVTPAWSLSGDDADDFSIGSGMLMFRATPDFEAPTDMGMDNMYMVTVMAEAGGEMDMMDVTVTVTNVEEMGEVTLWAGMVALTMPPQVGDTITGAVEDDDGVTGESWQWSRTTTPDMMASWMDIDGETNADYTVMEGDTGYYLRVMATYTGAVGTDMDMAYSMPTMMVGAVVDEPGMVTLWAGNDPLTMAPQVGDTITGLVVDPDGSVTGEMWQWSRSMNMTDWDEITGATDATYMTVAMDEGYYLRVMATYTDAVGTAMVDSMPTMMVVPVGGGDHPLVTKFDYNGNGQIDKSDVVDAINAYLDEVEGISKTDVIDLINYYLDG